jgi:D-alanyl-D-alanine carboxypeptidase
VGGTDASGDKVRSTSVLEVASVTKVFVGALVLALAEDGVLGLDDHVGAHVSGLLRDDGGITVRSLLNHTSGLPDFFDDPAFRTGWLANRSREPPVSELVRIVQRLPRRERGVFGYANVNYVIVGSIVEAATGRSVADALRMRILEPHGLATSHLPSTPMAVSGGLRSPASEVARFLAALMQEEVVGGASLREMLAAVPSHWPESQGYGLGIERVESLTGAGPSGAAAWGHLGLGRGATLALTTRDGSRQLVLGTTAMVASDAAWAALDRLTWAVLCPESRPPHDRSPE